MSKVVVLHEQVNVGIVGVVEEVHAQSDSRYQDIRIDRLETLFLLSHKCHQ